MLLTVDELELVGAAVDASAVDAAAAVRVVGVRAATDLAVRAVLGVTAGVIGGAAGVTGAADAADITPIAAAADGLLETPAIYRILMGFLCSLGTAYR